MKRDRLPRRLDRLERSVLSTQVSRVLMSGLLKGHFRPGDRLVENELADLLGVSRSPIREAFTELARSGVVEREPGRGVTIRKWSATDLDELFGIRSLLEGYAARTLVGRDATGRAGALDGIVEQMEEAAATGDYAQMVELDLEFHKKLWRLAGNALLCQVLDGLSHQFRLFLTLNWKFHGGLDQVPENHRKVIRALRSRDPAIAEKAMHDHVVVERMIAALRHQEQELAADSPAGG